MKKINLLTVCIFALFVLNASAEPSDTDKALGSIASTLEKFFAPKKEVTPKSWYAKASDTITSGINDAVKDCSKETVKSAYTTAVLNPFIINPLKNLFATRSEKMQKDTAEIVVMSEQIKKLKDSGACRKYITSLQSQLKNKMLDSIKKNDPKNGKK